jgi:hypothetical protein
MVIHKYPRTPQYHSGRRPHPASGLTGRNSAKNGENKALKKDSEKSTLLENSGVYLINYRYNVTPTVSQGTYLQNCRYGNSIGDLFAEVYTVKTAGITLINVLHITMLISADLPVHNFGNCGGHIISVFSQVWTTFF